MHVSVSPISSSCSSSSSSSSSTSSSIQNKRSKQQKRMSTTNPIRSDSDRIECQLTFEILVFYLFSLPSCLLFVIFSLPLFSPLSSLFSLHSSPLSLLSPLFSLLASLFSLQFFSSSPGTCENMCQPGLQVSESWCNAGGLGVA